MNKANRAAQFNPFDTLKGLKEALREKEEKLSRVPKRELSEEQQEEVSIQLSKIERGTMVDMTFFDSGHYVSLIDKVAEMNVIYRYIVIGKAKIYFDDIYDIKLI